MGTSFKIAGRCAAQSYQAFRWGELAPLLPLLAAQWLFLILGLNLGATWGMAVAGTIARWIAGNAALDYPGFLQLLPLTFSYVESVTFIIVGAVAIPMVVSRVLARIDPAAAKIASAKGRVRAAILPTFLALLAAFLLTYAWQLFASRGLHSVLAPLIQGWIQSGTATWVVSVVVGYAITTLLIFVPVVAISEDLGPFEAFRRGVRVGVERFLTTYPFALLLSLPALLLQLVVQVGGAFISNRTRPENIAYLLLLYVVLSTVAIYLVWNMATRYYAARTEGK